MKFLRSLALSTAVILILSACGSDVDSNKVATTKLTVFAAKSLTRAFTQIDEEIIQKKYPQLSVTFSFDGSNTLVKQIFEGAPADVLATADQQNMANAATQGLVEDVQPFASNILALIVPTGNPANITGLNSSLNGTKLVICAARVPCGNATLRLAEKLGITLNPVSEEKNVGDVRSKVEKGEADAGLVYITDARSCGDKVEIIEVPGIDQVINIYPIAVVKGTDQPSAAKTFIEVVLSPAGQQILAEYGFKGYSS